MTERMCLTENNTIKQPVGEIKEIHQTNQNQATATKYHRHDCVGCNAPAVRRGGCPRGADPRLGPLARPPAHGSPDPMGPEGSETGSLRRRWEAAELGKLTVESYPVSKNNLSNTYVWSNRIRPRGGAFLQDSGQNGSAAVG